jgi:hypothetical protein
MNYERTKPTQRAYLGDSVYADTSHDMVRIYTDNGAGPDQRIYLEREVFDALVFFASRFFSLPDPTEDLRALSETRRRVEDAQDECPTEGKRAAATKDKPNDA